MIIIRYQILMQHFIELSNGQTLRYYESIPQQPIKLPTILLLHGNFSSLEWWLDVIKVLDTNLHIIALDQRGFGQSTYKKPCSQYKDWALDLVDFCSLKKIESIVAIGWSWGGAISMKLAEIAPKLVSKVILTCSVGYKDFFLPKDDGTRIKTRQDILESTAIKMNINLMQNKSKESIEHIFNKYLFITMQFYQGNKDILIQSVFKQRCYIDLIYSLCNSDIDQKNIQAEVLVIHGKKDGRVLWDDVKYNAQYFKNYILWENGGHMIPLENTPLYVEQIMNFIMKK